MTNNSLSSNGDQPDPCADLPPDPSVLMQAIISSLDDLLENKPTKTQPVCFRCAIGYFLGDLNSPDRFEIIIRSSFLQYLVKLVEKKRGGTVKIRYLGEKIAAKHLSSCVDERASVLFRLCLYLAQSKFKGLHRIRQLLHEIAGLLRNFAEKRNYVLHFNGEIDTISEIPLILDALGSDVVGSLDRCLNSPSSKENTESFSNFFWEFKAFSHLLYHSIQNQDVKPSPAKKHDCGKKVDALFCIGRALLIQMSKNLKDLGKQKPRPEWSMYLPILEELNFMFKVNEGAHEFFWSILKDRKPYINFLIVQFARRTEDWSYEWLLDHNDVTDSDSRIHLALLMIPRVNLELDLELIQKLFVWYQHLMLVAQFGVSKIEELNDPKVLNTWLCRLSKAIFNSKTNPLFLESPTDPTMFYINPELKPESFDYECAEFAGQVIALALMCKVHIDVTLDRVFLSQLNGKWDDSCVNCRRNNKALVSFFDKGFAHVLGVPVKELLSFRGLEVKDINVALQRLRCPHHIDDDTNGEGMREADVGPLLLQYQRVRKEGRKIENWKRGRILGSGSYGEVYLGLADGGFFLAAKKVPLADAKKVSSIEKEIDLLCQFDHENIVEYFGTKKEETYMYVFLEFVSGSSLDKVYGEFRLDDFQISCYTKQILKGLNYLHERNIRHGDIKCGNILLNEDGNVKIADFGFITTMELSLGKSSRGSLVLSPPEGFDVETHEDHRLKADIWSVGCTVLEMFNGNRPNSLSIPDNLSSDTKDFIKKCLQVKPEERPTAAQLLEHPFVNKVKESSNNS